MGVLQEIFGSKLKILLVKPVLTEKGAVDFARVILDIIIDRKDNKK